MDFKIRYGDEFVPDMDTPGVDLRTLVLDPQKKYEFKVFRFVADGDSMEYKYTTQTLIAIGLKSDEDFTCSAVRIGDGEKLELEYDFDDGHLWIDEKQYSNLNLWHESPEKVLNINEKYAGT